MPVCNLISYLTTSIERRKCGRVSSRLRLHSVENPTSQVRQCSHHQHEQCCSDDDDEHSRLAVIAHWSMG
jgi:hypothetical protein